MCGHTASFEARAPGHLQVEWRLGDGSTLRLLANLSDAEAEAAKPVGQTLFASSAEAAIGALGPWAVLWTLDERSAST
jgi:maltooligosyltrehalose trehalohydrolase